MSTSRSISVALVAAVAPPIVLAAFGLLLALGVPPVTGWFWPAPDTNLTEAAALGDAARVRVLAAAGAALDAPLPVRDAIRDSAAPRLMTPLEAAMRRGNDELVRLLLELGATPSVEPATAAAP